MILRGNIVDVHHSRVFSGEVHIEGSRITRIVPVAERFSNYLMPGFVDAHIHVESTMLVPSEFARMAAVHGTVATVSDPHEIANVCGMEGVEFMIDDARAVPVKIAFGAPSCVPATVFETAGARLGPEDVGRLLQREDIYYLSEVMNFPGVIAGDADMLAKIALAKQAGKPIDGHAPGLRGDGCRQYFASGITTDHECFEYEEAAEKIRYGCHIIIREGSAARNFDALHPLIDEHPDRVMLGSDDKHPNELAVGHINELIARAVAAGHDLYNVLRAACVNPVRHYRLPVGLLREGDPADLIEVEDLKAFRVTRTIIAGRLVAENGKTLIPRGGGGRINRFDRTPLSPESLRIARKGNQMRVIRALDGQLITPIELHAAPPGEFVNPDPAQDLLKLVVASRYDNSPPAVAFIRGFGLQRGAIASTVAHDSHNIIAVGCDDASIAAAMNAVIESKGGQSVVADGVYELLPLPVAGLMSDADAWEVATAYARIDAAAKRLGSTLAAPFMTLSFMALLVIPSIKLSDKGLFDGEKFAFVNLFTSA